MVSSELARLLTQAGHKVTPQQLLLVAGAMGEPRFELDVDSSEIRATYGHSTRVKMTYKQKKAPEYLFHATPLTNLRSIFEARSGLKSMARQMVHLSEDVAAAEGTASRWNEPFVVLRMRSESIDGLEFAANDTWLAPTVAADDLEVLTVREIARYLGP